MEQTEDIPMHKISGILVCTKNQEAKDTVLKY